MTFGLWVKQEREARSWSRADFARKARIADATIHNVEEGKKGIGPDLCHSIADALEIPDEIVFRQAGLIRPKQQEEIDAETTAIAIRLKDLPPEDKIIVRNLVESLLSRHKD